VFQGPRAFDKRPTEVHDTPDSWADHVGESEREKVAFVPLADGEPSSFGPGWCTYAGNLEKAPDTEVICGGMNSKLPTAAAVWRQGNLLHFGFQQDPSELNERGRALLENCIVYGAKFRGDRPLGQVRSVFVDRASPRPKSYLRAALAKEDSELDDLVETLEEPLQAKVRALGLAEARKFLQARLDRLAAGSTGRLTLDDDAERLGVALDAADYVERVAALARDGESAQRPVALALLARRVPGGPVGKDAEAWGRFAAEVKGRVFFTELGGYVWLVDELARTRGVTSAELRGAARADR
jgi:hypothetical protein